MTPSTVWRFDILQEFMLKKFNNGEIIRFHENPDQFIIDVQVDSLANVLMHLRDSAKLKFNQLSDLFAIDYPNRPKRFEMVYVLMSYEFNKRLIVKTHVDEEGRVPSVARIYSAATWYEREVWDLFGVRFDGNTDLRRLLTDYNFEGHPFRKDFPLTGYVEPRYDVELKKVVFDKVSLPQEYRTFDTLSPWEGMTVDRRRLDAVETLPGDEKAGE